MKTIYKSTEGKATILALYDKQLQRLKVPFKDLYIETSFGVTHLIETGDNNGKPLLVFHGGNATTAYNLLTCDFLLKDFHIYAVDTIGHPGKSAEVCLSPKVMAGEKDCLFPAKKVIPQAEKIIPNCTTYSLIDRGHISPLTEEEKQKIVAFLLK